MKEDYFDFQFKDGQFDFQFKRWSFWLSILGRCCKLITRDDCIDIDIDWYCLTLNQLLILILVKDEGGQFHFIFQDDAVHQPRGMIVLILILIDIGWYWINYWFIFQDNAVHQPRGMCQHSSVRVQQVLWGARYKCPN